MGAQSRSDGPAERAMLSIMAELAADGESIAIGDDQTCRADDPACRGGVYVLRLAVGVPLLVRFGRYAGGRAIAVPASECLYVGSALGARGAVALAGRLLRHATRTDGRPAHAIREPLRARLAAAGLVAPLPAGKTLRWHIDYLLDEAEVAMTGVVAMRTTARLEGALVERLLAQPGVVPLAPGLGGSDDRGRSHLLVGGR